jgi:hypothetical protein
VPGCSCHAAGVVELDPMARVSVLFAMAGFVVKRGIGVHLHCS